MTFTSPISVAAAALVAALALTGCGGSDSGSADSSPDAAQSGSGQSTGPTGTSTVQVGEQDGDATFENQDGTSSGTQLPAGFPLKQIPIAKGTIVGGSQGKTDGPYAYTVILRVPGDSAAAAMKGITEQLTGAGFTAEPGPDTASISTATFRNRKYDVGVNVIRAEGKTTATYVVVRKVS